MLFGRLRTQFIVTCGKTSPCRDGVRAKYKEIKRQELQDKLETLVVRDASRCYLYDMCYLL